MSHSLPSDMVQRIEEIVEKVHGPGNIVSISQPTSMLVVEIKVLRADGCEISYLIPEPLPVDQGLMLKIAEQAIVHRTWVKNADGWIYSLGDSK